MKKKLYGSGKKISFYKLEELLGSDKGISQLAKDEDEDKEYRRMVQTLNRILEGNEFTDKQQRCIQLYYFEGMKMREVAKEMGVQIPAVSKTLKRARTKVKAIMLYSFDRLQ